jgi:hypothetical protein
MLEVPKFTIGCAVILSVLFQRTNRTPLKGIHMKANSFFKITEDDLSRYDRPTFVTFGETMLRDTPADIG